MLFREATGVAGHLYFLVLFRGKATLTVLLKLQSISCSAA